MLGVLVAVLDGCTVGPTWELLSLLRDAWGLGGESGVWCESNAWRWKLSSLWVLNHVLRLVVHEVPGRCAGWRLGRSVLLSQQNKFNQQIAGNRGYKLFLPSYTSILISSHIIHNTSFLSYLDIRWLAHNNTSPCKTHSTTYKTLYFPSGLPSTTCNCIIILMLRM